jgi:hypothetical protein
MGQEPYIRTDKLAQQVQAMAAYGIPQDKIAAIIGCAESTLKKHYPIELNTGSHIATSKVAETLFQRATSKGSDWNATAAIFWLKTRGGWRETPIDINLNKRYVIEAPRQMESVEEWEAELPKMLNQPRTINGTNGK